jgi:hypothetical protein
MDAHLLSPRFGRRDPNHRNVVPYSLHSYFPTPREGQIIRTYSIAFAVTFALYQLRYFGLGRYLYNLEIRSTVVSVLRMYLHMDGVKAVRVLG